MFGWWLGRSADTLLYSSDEGLDEGLVTIVSEKVMY